MGRPTHHLIADAERVHDVERQERDVRRLEHVAAGIEYEIGQLPRRVLFGNLAEPRQQRVVELQPRQRIDVARYRAKALDPGAALRRRVVLGLRHGDARHTEQKTRIDAVIARLDAFAREETAARPFARRIVAGAATQQIDDAADDLGRILPLFSGEPGRLSRRADFDAFAAARAGVDHGVDTALQCQFEALSHAHIVMPLGARLKGVFTRSARAFV